jgi:hypothetical protein
LANIGSNKIVVAGKEFLLTGVNGEHTDALEFVYTVKVDNNVNAEDFNIDSTKDIVLTDVKDVDGNSIDWHRHSKVQASPFCQFYQSWQ